MALASDCTPASLEGTRHQDRNSDGVPQGQCLPPPPLSFFIPFPYCIVMSPSRTMSAPPSPIVLHTVPLLYSDESLKDNVCPPPPLSFFIPFPYCIVMSPSRTMSAPPSPIVLHTVPLLYSDESLKDNVCPALPYRSSYRSPTV